MPSLAWGYEGPWRVVETDHHYHVYSVSRDTMTLGVDYDFEPRYPLKEQALDMAEALNDARERRIYQKEHPWMIPRQEWVPREEP